MQTVKYTSDKKQKRWMCELYRFQKSQRPDELKLLMNIKFKIYGNETLPVWVSLLVSNVSMNKFFTRSLCGKKSTMQCPQFEI